MNFCAIYYNSNDENECRFSQEGGTHLHVANNSVPALHVIFGTE